MADLTLRINADYKAASEAFKELANSSESTREKIEKFSAAFEDKKINSFIDKQKLLEASMKGTRGETDAAKAASNNYQKEIERLIRSGLDPESEAIQRLVSEQNKLKDKIKEATEVQQAQEQFMKSAEKAALGMIAAIGASVVAIGAATQKTAEAGDQYAKTARIIGMTAETFQELDYAAKMSGVDNLQGSLERLNKTVSDVKSGTGSLTSYLKDNDQQLLNQLENVNSNEEAFNLLMKAIDKAPDEFSRAELATAAFGKSGQQLILMAKNGSEGIAELREEARKYGVISNEAALQSEEYLDAQARLKAALTGVSTELTSKLLPSLTDVINGVANFIASIDDWENKLETIGYVLAGVTAGLIAFLVVAKGAAIIHGVATAFKALTAAMAANPIGAIAVLITAVLIPALIALYKNWDTVQTYLQQGIARVQYAFKWLGSVIEEGLVVAFNTVKAAGATLIDFIYGNIIRGIGTMLDVMGQLPVVGGLFQAAAEKVNFLGNAIGNIAEETRRSSAEAIAAAHAKQDATQEELQNTLISIDTEAQARRAAIEAQKKENNEVVSNTEETQTQITEIKRKALEEQLEQQVEQIKTLQERLSEIPLTEKQIQGQQMEQFTSFLNQRMKLERLEEEEKIAWLEEQQQLLLESETIFGEEKIALNQAINDAIKEQDEKLKESQNKILAEKLKATSTFFKGIEDLAALASDKSEGLAILEKSMAAAQAAINSYLAFTNALATVPFPFNYVAAAGVLASGIAQQVKILSTPIPSAETGGRFIVPHSVGSDSSLMRVNSDEEVEITPRGMTGYSGQQRIIVEIEKQPIFDIVNEGIGTGDIHIMATNY
ncbi:MAG: hypothetical protein LBQ13_02900 [Endomicrobium sp.]|nr:hypothetical protein [Endomicrobium sp.]